MLVLQVGLYRVRELRAHVEDQSVLGRNYLEDVLGGVGYKVSRLPFQRLVKFVERFHFL